MVEFALVAPVLLLMIFGIIDLGRIMYFYVTLKQATAEGARVAIAAGTPSGSAYPSDADVELAVTNHAISTQLANPCNNGPITSAAPPANTGYIFITEPNPPTTVETSPPANAPGGEPTASASGACSAVNPATNNAALQVTIKYNFVPMTPLIQSITGNQIILTASSTYRTEY
jgi:Flp pilus assembly protein TadG